MTRATLITTSDFCTWHQVDQTFVRSLHKAGLVEVTVVDQQEYIPETELQKLEKMIRLHNELEINLEGIEAITHLLERLENIQDEIRALKNRLKLYEENGN
jgi:chaperone modulatory protein CbpM